MQLLRKTDLTKFEFMNFSKSFQPDLTSSELFYYLLHSGKEPFSDLETGLTPDEADLRQMD